MVQVKRELLTPEAVEEQGEQVQEAAIQTQAVMVDLVLL
jgi:hypothetical protein